VVSAYQVEEHANPPKSTIQYKMLEEAVLHTQLFAFLNADESPQQCRDEIYYDVHKLLLVFEF
jgi:hypothetical protein